MIAKRETVFYAPDAIKTGTPVYFKDIEIGMIANCYLSMCATREGYSYMLECAIDGRCSGSGSCYYGHLIETASVIRLGEDLIVFSDERYFPFEPTTRYKVKKMLLKSDMKPPYKYRLKIEMESEEMNSLYEKALERPWLEPVKCVQYFPKKDLPVIDKAIFSGPATVVIWKDGTKTVVKAHNEAFDKEKGLAMAIAEKYFGNYTRFKKAVADAENRNEEMESSKATGINMKMFEDEWEAVKTVGQLGRNADKEDDDA